MGTFIRSIWTKANCPVRVTWHSSSNVNVRVFKIIYTSSYCSNSCRISKWERRCNTYNGRRNGGRKSTSSESIQRNAICLECRKHCWPRHWRSVSRRNKLALNLIVSLIQLDNTQQSSVITNSSQNIRMHCRIS